MKSIDNIFKVLAFYYSDFITFLIKYIDNIFKGGGYDTRNSNI
jgi:hypothetical protein